MRYTWWQKLLIILVFIIMFFIFIDSYHKGKGAREREKKEYKQNILPNQETLSTLEYVELQNKRLEQVEAAAKNRFKNYENENLTKIGISPEIQHSVYGWAQNTGIDEALIYAIIEYESSFNPKQYSKGDYGLMQVNKVNVDYYYEFFNGNLDPYDINDNVYMGCQILKSNYYPDDLNKTLMIYNMGSKKAKEFFNKGIYSTKYSRNIIEKAKLYKKILEGTL